LSETISASDFTIQADSTASLQTEHHMNVPVTLKSIGAFEAGIKLSCSVSTAPYLSCSVPPSEQLQANGTVVFQVAIETDAIPDYMSNVKCPNCLSKYSKAWFAFVLFPLLFFRKRNQLIRAVSTTVLLFAAAASISGCSGKYPGHTPPGTYTLNIHALGTTANGAQSQEHSTAIDLIVVP